MIQLQFYPVLEFGWRANWLNNIIELIIPNPRFQRQYLGQEHCLVNMIPTPWRTSSCHLVFPAHSLGLMYTRYKNVVGETMSEKLHQLFATQYWKFHLLFYGSIWKIYSSSFFFFFPENPQAEPRLHQKKFLLSDFLSSRPLCPVLTRLYINGW